MTHDEVVWAMMNKEPVRLNGDDELFLITQIMKLANGTTACELVSVNDPKYIRRGFAIQILDKVEKNG